MSRREKRQTRPASLLDHQMYGPPPGGAPPPPMPMHMPYEPYFAGPPPGAPYNYPPPLDPRHIPLPSAPFPPPAAPQAPNSGQPTPYSTHHPSPTSSSENLSYQPYPASAHHHGMAPAPPPPLPQPMFFDDMGPAPQHGKKSRGDRDPRGPAPTSAGDLGRRNTTNTRPAIHHYDTEPLDYRPQHPRMDPRDMSPPSESSGDRGGPFMVIPGSGGGIHRSASYQTGIGSGFSDGSYEGGDLRHGLKGYIISSGSQHGQVRNEKEREYQLNRGPNQREREGGRKEKSRRERPATMYQIEGPPRRADSKRGDTPSEISMSRPPAPQAFGPDEGYFDSPPPPQSRQPRSTKRIASGAPSNDGALVRRRSRSVSDQGSHTQALVRRRSNDNMALAPPPPNTIRLEIGGQAIDISYTGNNGKPLVGNITINTTARTIEPAPAPQPEQKALPPPEEPRERSPSPPPAPAPLAILPPGVTPVMIPAPPPLQPMEQALALRAPPPQSQYSSDPASPPLHARPDVREDLYHNMESLALSQPPPSHAPGGYPDHDRMPPAPRSRSLSRGPAPRAPSPSREDGPPLWTKISRDIVSKRAVLVQGYVFEEQGDTIVIRRLLNEQEIDDLIALSDQIRSGKKEVIRLSEREKAESSSGRSRRDRDRNEDRERERREKSRDRHRERERESHRERESRRRPRPRSTSSRRPLSIGAGPGAFPTSRSPSRSPSPSSESSRSPSPDRRRRSHRQRPRDPLDPGPSKDRPAPVKPALRPAPPEAPLPPDAGGESQWEGAASEEMSPPPAPPVEVVKMGKEGKWGGVWKYGVSNSSEFGGGRGGSRRNTGDGSWYEVERPGGEMRENPEVPGTYVGYTRTPGRPM